LVSLALDALTRCELQRAAAEVLPTCNGLLEWRRWSSHCGCELPETPDSHRPEMTEVSSPERPRFSAAATAVGPTSKLNFKLRVSLVEDSRAKPQPNKSAVARGGLWVGARDNCVGGSAAAVGGLGKLASVFTVAGFALMAAARFGQWLRDGWCRSPLTR